MKLVIIESPYKGKTKKEIKKNIKYAELCLLDSLMRNEAPFASHLLYTRVLDDGKQAERKTGMLAGFAWGQKAGLCAVYCDLGISDGMMEGIKKAECAGIKVERRYLLVTM